MVQPKGCCRRTRFSCALFMGLGVLVLLAMCGCGASSSVSSTQSSRSGGSGGSGGSAGNSFKPRPFPGDFFVRLSPQAGSGYAAAAAYDPPLKEVFVSDPITNTVEVYSTVDAHQVGEISVPGPAGLSFSPDFSKLVIGTITPYIYTADPVALHLTDQIAIPASYLPASLYSVTELPVVPFAMADGTIIIGLGVNSASTGEFNTTVEHLVLYNPSGDTFTPADPGSGSTTTIPARSADGKCLLVLDTTATLFVFKSGGPGTPACFRRSRT